MSMRWGISTALVFVLGCQSGTNVRSSDYSSTPFLRSLSVTLAQQDHCVSSGLITEADCSTHSSIRTSCATTAASSELEELPPGKLRLTLREAIESGLMRNPDLVALRQNGPISHAALEVAKNYPYNPLLEIDVRPFAREDNGANARVLNSTVVLQEFELAHQGRHRELAGAAELDRTHWRIEQAEVLGIAKIEQRFFAAIYQRQRYELAKSLADINDQMLGALERRFEAGQTTATDRSLARIQSSSTRQQAELARANYEAALVDLRGQLGYPATVSLDLVGDLTSWQWAPVGAIAEGDARVPGGRSQPDTETMDLSRLVSNRPDVQVAGAEVVAARARLDLACASRVPNVKAGPVYERDEAGTSFIGLQAQMSIPVLNTGTPLVRQRQAELRQSEVTLEQVRLKAGLEIEAAVARYDRARQVAERFGGDFTDGLTKEMRSIEDQFEAGQTDLLRVYAARTSLIQTRQTNLDAFEELAQAAAGITATTGLRPESLLSSPEPAPPKP